MDSKPFTPGQAVYYLSNNEIVKDHVLEVTSHTREDKEWVSYVLVKERLIIAPSKLFPTPGNLVANLLMDFEAKGRVQ